MTAQELISEIIPPIRPDETAEKALSWMHEYRIGHLPVVDKKEYIGLLSENDIYDMTNPKEKIEVAFKNLPKPFIYANRHVYDVMKLIADAKITVVPILNENNEYVGCTDLLFLMSQITVINSIKEPGGILVLVMNIHDYSLTQIARLVEENNAKILSSYITSSADSTEIEVTLKINTTDLDRIIQTFNRFDYVVKASFSKGMLQEDLKKRYDELMTYLNI